MRYNEQTKQWESPYWHPAVTTDSVVVGFDGEQLNVLLIQRGLEPYKNMWALPGGFMRPEDESAEACAYRELREETDVDDIYMEEFHTFSNHDRDPRERVITIAFFALVPLTTRRSSNWPWNDYDSEYILNPLVFTCLTRNSQCPSYTIFIKLFWIHPRMTLNSVTEEIFKKRC